MPSQTDFLDPEKILAQCQLKIGDRVADFGCSAGYFSLRIAEKIGSEGRVYALDVLTSALEAVSGKARFENIHNITTSRVNVERLGGSKLDHETIDFVVMKDMLHQNTDKEVILKEAYRVLKPGGSILIIEWRKEGTLGPEKSLRVLQEDIKNLARAVGFTFTRDIEAGIYHYGFLAAK